jgi:hypothetical protein
MAISDLLLRASRATGRSPRWLPILLSWALLSCGDGLTFNANSSDPRYDNDGDGYCASLVFCEDGSRPGDCDDTDAAIGPAAVEVCGDDIDQDCTGGVDDGHADSDGDGSIAAACDDGDDCDDGDPALNQSDSDGDGPSTCDGDCDDGDPALNQTDADSDGFTTCEGDCDDFEDAATPTGTEQCADEVDNDCNGITDDCCMGLDFDGQSDFASIDHSDELNLASGSFTVEAWAYLDGYSALNVSPIISKMSLDTEISHGWSIWAAGYGTEAGYLPGTLVASIRLPDGQSHAVMDTNTVAPEESWFHVAATYDAISGNLALWLDGAFVASTPSSPPPSTSHVDLLLGLYRPLQDCGGSCRYWDGQIDEVRLSSEVRYKTGFFPIPHFAADATTIALWHFNEGDGESVFDGSGNGRDLSIYGADWIENCP